MKILGYSIFYLLQFSQSITTFVLIIPHIFEVNQREFKNKIWQKNFHLSTITYAFTFATNEFFFPKKNFPPEKWKLKRKFRNPCQMQLQSPFLKHKSHMITQSDALNNQKRPKNASKIIKFPCDISPCNIPSVSHAIWVSAILRYTISRCISIWVPIIFYVPYCNAIFFCNIAYRMSSWCKIPLKALMCLICVEPAH